MAVQGVLKRKIDGKLSDTYLKTSADLVVYDEDTTVLDRLSSCLEQINQLNLSSNTVDTRIQTAIDSLYTELAGVSDASELSGDAYNTIKKISTALKSNTGKITTLQTDLETITKDLESYVKASDLATVATSGKYSDLIGAPTVTEYTNATTAKDGLMSSDDKTKLDGIHANATLVEASDNGYISINGVKTKVYEGGTITKADLGLENVGNFKAVSTVADQGLTSAEQANARANIGASAFSGSYNDLTDKPTNATTASDGLMSSDDKTSLDNLVTNAVISITKGDTNGHITVNGSTDVEVYTAGAITAADVGLDKVGNFKAVSTEASQGLTSTEQSNARNNIGAASSADMFSGDYNDLANKPSEATESTSGLMSASDKASLNNLTANAITSIAKGIDNGHITVNGTDDIEVYTAPSLAAVATSGSYNDLTDAPVEATTAKSGLMSAADKDKLDSLDPSAGKTTVEKGEVNGHITVDGTDIEVYTAPTLSAVATSGSYNDLTDTPSNATTSTSGLMSASDKTTVDALSSSAITSVAKGDTNGHITVTTNSGSSTDIEVYTAGSVDIPEATQTSAGLMSAADKTKLDNMSSGGITEGTVGTLTSLTFSNSTYYSISNGYYRCSDGICVVTGIVTCNKLVVPAADTVVNSSMPTPAVEQKVDIVPTSEASYPPIQITMKTNGTFNIQGGASGCTYNVQFMYIATV